MRSLFLVFLVVPLVEIYFLIQIGSVVGAGWTIFLVVFTAMLGAFLVRAQGFSTLARVQTQLAKSEMPAMEIIEGLFLFVAGALLLTPGFFTDAIGFICLTPPLRRGIIRYFINKGSFNTASMHQAGFQSTFDSGRQESGQAGKQSGFQNDQPRTRGRVIDVEYRDDD